VRRLSVALLVVVGCVPSGPDSDAGSLVDSGRLDAAVPDSGPRDAGSFDAGLADAGLTDAGLADAGLTDAGSFDAGFTDAGFTDTGLTDAGLADAGLTDAGLTDAGLMDGGLRDAGSLDAGTFVISRQVVDGGTGNPVELLTLTFPGRETTYAQWMPVRLLDGGVAPALLLTKPYDGISWPNDARDRRWASQGEGLHPDVDGPGAGATPESIVYSPLTIEAQADEAAFYALHGISTLAVYGRFYAGGSIQNDVDDMVTGLEFLAREPGVDRSRIGIQGGSWGGFLALYGAAFAPAAATPRIGAALYPLSDFAEEWRHVTITMPSRLSPDAGLASSRFFEPYLRRVAATTGGGPDAGGVFTRFDVGALESRLRTPFFIVHEDWDALVGIDQSQRLAARRSDLIRPLWLRHDTAPTSWDTIGTSHGPLMGQFGGTASFTFVWSNLLRELAATQTIFVPWTESSFVPMLVHARDRGRSGTRHDELARELNGLLDPRIFMYRMPEGADAGAPLVESGSVFVSRQVNANWGSATTSATIAQVLDGGLPP
jgi:hypothetical protein